MAASLKGIIWQIAGAYPTRMFQSGCSPIVRGSGIGRYRGSSLLTANTRGGDRQSQTDRDHSQENRHLVFIRKRCDAYRAHCGRQQTRSEASCKAHHKPQVAIELVMRWIPYLILVHDAEDITLQNPMIACLTGEPHPPRKDHPRRLFGAPSILRRTLPLNVRMYRLTWPPFLIQP